MHPIPPSALTPAGVVKHLTGVERFWFSIDFAGADLAVARGRPARQLPAGAWRHACSDHDRVRGGV
ncbi:MAG: DinB family protein, partial [Actinomycetota bacterium]|nr:DinB family protein [Actinomycetota bacterium]